MFAEKMCKLDIILTRTVNISTPNKLIKLTMLWTAGPWRKIQLWFCSTVIRLVSHWWHTACWEKNHPKHIMSLLTWFQSNWDTKRMIMKCSVTWSTIQLSAEFYLQWDSKLGPHAPKSAVLTTHPAGHLITWKTNIRYGTNWFGKLTTKVSDQDLHFTSVS